MIPVLGPAAIREADAWTIAHEPIDSWALMERAAQACTRRLSAWLRAAGSPPVNVVAGMGNNGGDGLAIARLLRDEGFDVSVCRVHHRERASQLNERNAGLLTEQGVPVQEVQQITDWAPPSPDGWIIDALMGTGLSAPLKGLAADMVRAMNACGNPIVAIDIPSGLFAESNDGNEAATVIRADWTLTLELPKLAFLLPEHGAHAGVWEQIPIGIDADQIRSLETPYRIMEEADARLLLRDRGRFSHKGSHGHALLVGGSEGRMGAAVLATQACLRSGAGLVTAMVPACGRDVLQMRAPEAMCIVDPCAGHLAMVPDAAAFQAVGVGPGMGMHAQSAQVIDALLSQARPLVIDADALNLLASNNAWLGRVPQGSILTPHPKEFERLASRTFRSGFERLQAARELAARQGCHLILKGAWTAICSPDGRVRFNPTGNPGMAKGGSGDALTGLITGLLAMGYPPEDACALGVYVHGLAGDLAAEHIGMDGMTAMDLVRHIPLAWRQLRGNS